MLKRVLTVVVGLPIVILLVHLGGLFVLLLCGVMALLGLRELYIALAGKHEPIHLLGYAFTVVYFTFLYLFNFGYELLIVLTLFIIIAQASLVAFFKSLKLEECIKMVYGVLYVPFLLSFVVVVRMHELGQVYVWLIFASAFGCDTFAYIVGVNFGKHRLTESPSPKKSVEGIFGGVFGAALMGGLYAFSMFRFTDLVEASFIPFAIMVCAVAAIFCIVGDMAASAIKRQSGIKDFGSIFPGHGGVLDRIDSIVLAAPVVFLTVWVVL